MSAADVAAAVLERLQRGDPAFRIAVVGASNNPAKYGQIIVRNLSDKRFTVIPINPKESEILGLRAYPRLSDVPERIDLVSIVTPPEVTLAVLDEVERLGLPAVFLQDGSWDARVAAKTERAPYATIKDACIMVLSGGA